MPASAKKCIRSWKKYCPDYEIIEWNETNYDFTKIPYMKEAYDAKKWGFVPDYARLDIVHQHGGIYLDTDVELLKPLDGLLSLKGFAGFESPQYIALGLGFGAEADNQIIKKLMDSYTELHFVDSDGNMNLTPSPQLNTEVFRRLGIKTDGTMQMIDDFQIFPKEYFCPRIGYGGKKRVTQNTYSDHHFDASWADEESKKKWAQDNRNEDKNIDRRALKEKRLIRLLLKVYHFFRR